MTGVLVAPAAAESRPRYISADPMVDWPRLARPIDWSAVFGRKAPLHVEIGYGNGENLVRRAAAEPESDFVGLELSWQSAKRALRRIAKAGTPNVRLVDLDARSALERLWAERSAAGLESLFPIPWPKDKHEGRRLFSRDFLRLTNSRLAPGGSVRIVTDFEPYARWVMEQVPGSGLAGECTACGIGFETKYERKWRAGGQETFYTISLSPVERVDRPPVEDTPLFTAHLTGVDPEKTAPQNQLGPVTVKFREEYYDPVRRTLLWRAFVVEGELVQDIWVKLEEETSGRWVLKAAPGGRILPTVGARRALELVLAAAVSAGADQVGRVEE